MARWKFERRKGACACCAREFEDQEKHASILTVSAGALLRGDVCVRCWEAGVAAEGLPVEVTDDEESEDTTAADEQAAETVVSEEPAGEALEESADADEAQAETPFFWWFTRHQKNKKRTVQLDLNTLEQLFLQLEGRKETKLRELRYVLCLLLMRKRRVRVERIQRGEEGESFIVKRPRKDERYQVFVYDFGAERMEELRAELQAIFDGSDIDSGISLPLEDAEQDDAEQSDGEAAAQDAGEDAGAATADGTAETADGAGEPDEEQPAAEIAAIQEAGEPEESLSAEAAG